MFKKADQKETALKIALMGLSGSGKTCSALRLARGLAGETGKIAFVDTENGSASLYADKIDFDVEEIRTPYDEGKFLKAILDAVQGGYSVLVIDSLSHLWEGTLSKKAAIDKNGGNSFVSWNIAGANYKRVIDEILASPIPVICCFRVKTAYAIDTDERGKSVPKKIGLAPIAREDTEYEFTTIFDIRRDDHKAVPVKDRTHVFHRRDPETKDLVPVEPFLITEETGKKFIEWQN